MHGALNRKALAWFAARAILGFARVVTGVRALRAREGLQAWPTLYFANHSSHGDFVLLWATLPPDLRVITRPVAGEDYWLGSRLRRFIGRDVFHALMIRRDGQREGDPVAQMVEALRAGDSLIMFPEGTRNTTDEVLLPLKSGLFHVDFLRLPPGTTHGFVTGADELVLLDIHTPGSRPDRDVYFVGDVPPGFRA